MSPAAGPARPSQVTVAGWAVTGASLIVVLTVFQSMGNLNSVDMRDELTQALSSGAAKNLGLSVSEAIEVVRWCLYVAGVAAVVTGILGIYVLQRNHAARIVLTLAAVPVVLTAPFAGSLPGLVVGAGAAMLWSRPARDWFAGRPITPPRPGSLFAPRTAGQGTRTAEKGPARDDLPPWPPVTEATPTTPEVRMPGPEAAGDPGTLPPPTAAWGAVAPPEASGSTIDFPAPSTAPVIPAAWPSPVTATTPAERGADARPPGKVRLACIFTWAFAGVSALIGIATLAAVAIARDDLVEQISQDSRWDQSLDTDLIAPALATFGAVLLLWSVLNAVLAYFVWRRSRAAWIGLTVSIGLAGAVATLGLWWSFVHVAALAASLGMLVSRPTREWFAGRS